MVKAKILFFVSAFVLTSPVLAALSVSIGTATWQEKIPVIYSGTEIRTKTSFTGLMFGLGISVNITNRWIWDMNGSVVAGLADIQKLDNAVVPRRNVNSIWFANRFVRTIGERVALGPNILVNYRKIDGLDGAISSGGFLDLDYRIFERSVMTQSIGTISDSKELAYSIKFTKYF
jgi:hypothetical protein